MASTYTPDEMADLCGALRGAAGPRAGAVLKIHFEPVNTRAVVPVLYRCSLYSDAVRSERMTWGL